MIFSNFPNVLVAEKAPYSGFEIVVDDNIKFHCYSSTIKIQQGLNANLMFEFNRRTKSFWIKEKDKENSFMDVPNDIWLLLTNKPFSGFKEISSKLESYKLTNNQQIGQFVKWSIPDKWCPKTGILCRVHPTGDAILRITFDGFLGNRYIFVKTGEVIECWEKSKEFRYALERFDLPFNVLWENNWRIL